ncbi:ankyrin repeat and SOCS box protein 18-like isoform X2 [Brienomyrus brachyistius]|uniref:ankyrin repeat and SOCS box protein 18-like isoform X2 n=1 Tax=Brienomyrus brachyistius TaxID=42636 RepID=UPI0020B26D3C|nr:ankyrin repeat and SOCS box protein 18-like isoform X2 [Brienomyrus brachyistius]
MNADIDPNLTASSDFVKKLNSAFVTDDQEMIEELLRELVGMNPNAIIELSNDDWMKDPSVHLPPAVLLGLHPLQYKQELTTPLRIAAAYGFTHCLQYLLEHGAQPNLIVGGKSALHEACENSSSECTEFLLKGGADPDLRTEEGLSAMHLCKTPKSLHCAKVLLEHGAAADLPSEEDEETALHVASRSALLHHAKLYLQSGADVNHTSVHGETPLGVACASSQDPEELLQICCLLLSYGADVNLADKQHRTPLHKAAHNIQHSLVTLLLEHKAEVNSFDHNGRLPLSCVLHSAAVRAEQEPHRVVQILLNHGSITLWPQALPKVLSMCAAEPKTVEVLFNSYTHIPVTCKWEKTIQAETLQIHQQFYQSLFALGCRPRCLQHLCRAAIRQHFGKDCHRLIPQLLIPKGLQLYLLLEPVGIFH